MGRLFIESAAMELLLQICDERSTFCVGLECSDLFHEGRAECKDRDGRREKEKIKCCIKECEDEFAVFEVAAV
jgi:hypothetical protein